MVKIWLEVKFEVYFWVFFLIKRVIFLNMELFNRFVNFKLDGIFFEYVFSLVLGILNFCFFLYLRSFLVVFIVWVVFFLLLKVFSYIFLLMDFYFVIWILVIYFWRLGLNWILKYLEFFLVWDFFGDKLK